jgi:hypothetical protein
VLTIFAAALAVSLLSQVPLRVSAQVAPPLGTVGRFGVLGASAVTNTGPSVISGNLGVSPGTSVTGFPPGIVIGGTIHQTDAVATQAQADALTVYNALAGQACDTNLTGQDLGGLTLTAGVYCYSSSAQLTGTVTLNAQGNPNAVFIFQIGSTLTTATASSVRLLNGASTCNVFFQIGSSATFGTTSTLVGNFFALASVTTTTGVRLSGRAVALNGAATLDSNLVLAPNGCGTPSPSPTPNPSPTQSPTIAPTQVPTVTPTGSPTGTPTQPPTVTPTESPTVAPTQSPTADNAAAPAAGGPGSGANATGNAGAAAEGAAGPAGAAGTAGAAGGPGSGVATTGGVGTTPASGPAAAGGSTSTTVRPPNTGNAGIGDGSGTRTSTVWLLSFATALLTLGTRYLVAGRRIR